VAAPIFCDPETPLPGKPSLGAPFFAGAGIGVLALTIAAYAFVPALRRVRTGAASGRRIRGVDLLLLGALPIYLLYVGNGFFLGSGDSLATRRLPSLILQEGTIDLAHTPPFDQRDQRHYSVLWFDEKTLPSFPLGTAFLAVPYTAVALAATRGEVNDTFVRWEKHLSALLATASACLLFLGLREQFGERAAEATAALFALATPMVTYTSQALWATTGEIFCVTLALWLLLSRGAHVLRASLAGLALGLAYFCRPTAVVALAVLGVALVLQDRRAALGFAAASAASVALVTLGLQATYGHPLGGYGILNAHPALYGRDLPNGLAGVLASPSRGLFAYLPYLLFVPLGFRAQHGGRELGRLVWASLVIAVGTYLLAASYAKWWGGWSLGPRLMTEAAPFLALLTLPLWLGWLRIGAANRVALVAAVVFASTTQLLAAYRVQGQHWNAAVDVDAHPEILWSLRNSQLAAIWWPGWRFRLGSDAIRTLDEEGVESQRWRRVDLTRAANARYDLDPFQPSAPRAWPRFGRVDPAALNQPRARFRFAPRGAPNAVTARGGLSPQISIGRVRARGIRAILSAEWRGDPRATPLVGLLHVSHADGARESIPLRLNIDVFPYQGDPFRAQPVPAERVYFGNSNERTVLVESVYPVGHNAGIDWIQLETSSTEPHNAVTLLALTLESVGASTAEGTPPGASS
jgi:hypothetical protein